MKYSWADGYPAKVSAEVVHAALVNLKKVLHREITSQDVVAAAKKDTHPLHPVFDWDDSVAADKWRREQAGAMIRHLRVQVVSRGEEHPVRVFASFTIEDSDKPVYMAITQAAQDEELREQLLRNARREMEAFVSKYNQIKALAGVIKSMKKVL